MLEWWDFTASCASPGLAEGQLRNALLAKNQASFWAQQRGEEIKRLRRWVLLCDFYGKEKLSVRHWQEIASIC